MIYASVESALFDLQQIAARQMAHYSATGKIFSPQATAQQLHEIADILHRVGIGTEGYRGGSITGPDGITRHYNTEEEPC